MSSDGAAWVWRQQPRYSRRKQVAGYVRAIVRICKPGRCNQTPTNVHGMLLKRQVPTCTVHCALCTVPRMSNPIKQASYACSSYDLVPSLPTVITLLLVPDLTANETASNVVLSNTRGTVAVAHWDVPDNGVRPSSCHRPAFSRCFLRLVVRCCCMFSSACLRARSLSLSLSLSLYLSLCLSVSLYLFCLSVSCATLVAFCPQLFVGSRTSTSNWQLGNISVAIQPMP
jgi:hypothetical protein